MIEKIDSTDRRILKYLQTNAAIPAAQLGERIGLSQAAVWRRIQRLEESGVIERRVALLNAEKVGLGSTVFALVRLTAHERKNLDRFIATIKAMATVMECHIILGDHDFLLKIAMADMHAYERFLFEELSAIDGVAEVKSLMALSPIKSETALPLTD